MSEEEGLEAKTPWGTIAAHGSTVLLLAAMGGLMWFTINEHQMRSREHDQLACLLKLDIFVHTFSAGETLDLRAMPTDVWGCIPEFLADGKRKRES